MIFRDVDVSKWCEMHDLEIEVRECPQCHERVAVDQPYETRDCVGLRMRQHDPCPGWTAMGRFKHDLLGDII